MTTVTLEAAQATLPELIEHLQPGEEITITDHGQPLAQVKKADERLEELNSRPGCTAALAIPQHVI